MRTTPLLLIRKARRKSPRQLAQYAAARFAVATRAAELDFPLLARDMADSAALTPPRPPFAARERPEIAWLAIPPSEGSGGHTTLFRMIAAADAAGYRNTLLLYDRYGSDMAAAAATVRRGWPWLQCDVEPLPERLEGFDAYVASSWPTAHVLATRSGPEARRLYFIQDFEPYFFARGAQYALAEDTYRFGFRNVALGSMVGDTLVRETSAPAAVVPFGCDTDTYRPLPGIGTRRGVVFYAKRGNDRRGFDLAVRALALFHRAHPEEPIHVCGDPIPDAPFPTVTHGSVSPARLNEIYNGVVAGLALSFTNISLVAEEMLAAGTVAVVNDSVDARADLPNPNVSWARPTPTGLAGALGEAVTNPQRDARARSVAASVAGRSWRPTADAVLNVLAEELAR